MKNKVLETPPQGVAYSHAEWAHSNLANYRLAEDARHRSEEVSKFFLSILIDKNNGCCVYALTFFQWHDIN